MEIYREASELRRFDPTPFRRESRPRGALVCPPDHFEVMDVRNVHMEGMVGSVNRGAAVREWAGLVAELEALGLGVERLDPRPGLVDMVFTCNPCLTGLDLRGRPLAILSRMRHPGRAGEVECHRLWLRGRGIRIVEIPPEVPGCWEGGGDSIWHPNRFFLWSGCGPRSDREPHQALSEMLHLPVALLRLEDPRFYHLDTCLAVLDEETAAWVPAAFDAKGRELIRAGFRRLIEVDGEEARDRLAANLYCPDGRRVLLPSRCPRTAARLEAAGFRVREVETGEFLKAGGSVYCLRQEFY